MKHFISVAIVTLLFSFSSAKNESSELTRLDAVLVFADNVLAHGRDVYGDNHTPLFADGINVDTKTAALWVNPRDSTEWMLSNLANQQNLFRTLVGLSNMTGDNRYRDAAVEATKYIMDHHRSGSGLFYWGDTRFVDLRTHERGYAGSGNHRFMNMLPFYSFLWEVDAGATEQLIKAIWDTHVGDWSVLDINRMGPFTSELDGPVWDQEFVGAEPFFEGRWLSFIPAGTDLIYSAAMLHFLSGQEKPLEWALRLAEQYVNARHPETGLGVYQFSQPEKREEPPDDPEHPRYTWSTYGDRAQRQLGPEFGEIALEGNVIRNPTAIYGYNMATLLQLGEELGGIPGEKLVEWGRSGLHAFASYGYDPQTNQVRPLLADGTDLTGFELRRHGYYGPEGRSFEPVTADRLLLYSYILGYRLTRDQMLWNTARAMARHQGLGDPGRRPGMDVALNRDTENADPVVLLALLELYEAVPDEDYLALAEQVGDNMISFRFHDGFFLPTASHVNARFDTLEPLALLALEAVLQGKPGLVPRYNTGRTTNDRFRTTWSQTR